MLNKITYPVAIGETISFVCGLFFASVEKPLLKKVFMSLFGCDVERNLTLQIKECAYFNLFFRTEIGRSVTLSKEGLNSLNEQCH